MEIVQRIDDYGKPAWIAVMILSFIVFWPIGLAVLGYMIWSGRMGCSSRRRRHRSMWSGNFEGNREEGGREEGRREEGRHEMRPSGFSRAMRAWTRHAPVSGNRAFDEYRAETMRRLEDEFDEFQGFLDQLRAARDKEEFDRFMNSRGSTYDAGDPNPGKNKDSGQASEQSAS